jgi:hypothetical protein
MKNIAVSDADLMKLTMLQREIAAHGTAPASFRARWEFGRILLDLEKGRPAFHGLGSAVARAIGIQASEVSRRKTFTVACCVETALANWSCWNRACNAKFAPGKNPGTACITAPGTAAVDNADQHVASRVASQPNKASTVRHSIQIMVDDALFLRVKEASDPDGMAPFARKAVIAALESKQAYNAELQVIKAHLADLRKEIIRVRSENACERGRRRWNADATRSAELITLLNYVEEELDKVPTARPNSLATTTTRKARFEAAAELHRDSQTVSETDNYNDHEERCSDTTLDDSFGGQVRSDVAVAGGTGTESQAC